MGQPSGFLYLLFCGSDLCVGVVPSWVLRMGHPAVWCIPTILWVWSLWVGVDPVGFPMGRPVGVDTYRSVGLISVGGCWPSWVLHGSPNGCGYLPFCGSDLCGWVLTQLGSPWVAQWVWVPTVLWLWSLWVTQRVWVPTVLWVWSLWVGVDPVGFSVGRPAGVGTYRSVGLISVGGCWPSWVLRGSPSGCGYLPFCGSDLCGWVLTQLGSPWVAQWCGYLPFCGSDLCGWVLTQSGSPSGCGYLPFCGSDLCGWVLTQLGSPWVAQWVWVPTILWVWSLWVGVDTVGFSVGRPAGVGTYHSVGLISVGGCWPSWVLRGSPSGCGYLPFCGSDLCGWVLTQLGSLWVTQWVWVPTILWVWSLWVGVDPVGFSVGRPVGVGTYHSVGLISVGGCWPSWVLRGSPSGCGYLPFCGSDLCGWVLTQLGSPWVAQRVWVPTILWVWSLWVGVDPVGFSPWVTQRVWVPTILWVWSLWVGVDPVGFSPWVAQWVWVPTILWVWSLWVGVDPVGFSVGRPVGVGTYHSVGLISVGGCWHSWVLRGSPSGCGYFILWVAQLGVGTYHSVGLISVGGCWHSWVLRGSPSGCGYLPFCGSDLWWVGVDPVGFSQRVWIPTILWVWSLWVGVDPVGFSVGHPVGVGTYHSVGLISVGGCWPSWVLRGSPSGCGYLPFCGSDLCGWVLTQLGSLWVAQRVWVLTILWAWSLWVGVDPVGFSQQVVDTYHSVGLISVGGCWPSWVLPVGRPVGVGTYHSVGLISVGGCWHSWVLCGSPSGCGYLPFCGSDLCGWVLTQLGSPSGCGYLPFCGSDLCGWVLTQLGSPWVAQRVWAMPQCVVNDMSYFISASAANKTLQTLHKVQPGKMHRVLLYGGSLYRLVPFILRLYTINVLNSHCLPMLIVNSLSKGWLSGL